MSSSPASLAIAVTPNDSADLPNSICRSLWVGGAGNVALVSGRNHTSVTFTNVPAGSVLPCNALRVLATGTTATAIIALY